MRRLVSDLRFRLPFFLALSLALGAALAALDAQGSFLIEWLGLSALLWVGALLLAAAWDWTGRESLAGWLLLVALVLRLGVGVALLELMPVAGYSGAVYQAGYTFKDAYSRDTQAWALADSGQPLWEGFTQELASDQYGGLLTISAALYRALSPDAHRPLLIVVLAAILGALGLPFFWEAVKHRWGQGVALPAAWILALYPEAVVLGGTQMREPFLISFIAIAFWGVIFWNERRRAAILALALSLAGMLLISWLVALPVMGILFVWFWLEYAIGRGSRRTQALGWGILALGGLVMVALLGVWFRLSAQYDAFLTFQGSGMVQVLIRGLGGKFLIPFVTAYGLVQPVLPAVLTDPDTVPLLRILWGLLAAGWYLLAPLLVYGFWTLWKSKDAHERRSLIWLGFLCWGWILISSIRAGGDQFDNPRYRTIFIVWLALLAGWGWQWARAHRDAWLGRWLAVEGVFLVFFTQWYASRNLHVGGRLEFWQIVGLVLLLSAGILVGGWWWDRRRKSKLA